MSTATATPSAPAGRAPRGVPVSAPVNTAPRAPATGNRLQSPWDQLAAARRKGLDRLQRVGHHFRLIDRGADERKGERLAQLVEELNGEQCPRERVRLFDEISALRDSLEIGGNGK